MGDGGPNPVIELEAARIAIEWKSLFASELRVAARQLAKGSPRVTAEHYRQALPVAVAKVLQAVNTCSTGSRDARCRIA
jgi:hypothetical protein